MYKMYSNTWEQDYLNTTLAWVHQYLPLSLNHKCQNKLVPERKTPHNYTIIVPEEIVGFALYEINNSKDFMLSVKLSNDSLSCLLT